AVRHWSARRRGDAAGTGADVDAAGDTSSPGGEVGLALSMIHARPGDPWTVARLADRVAMSRSAFAERFAGAVGEPPLRYLTTFRMRRAAELLRTSAAGVREIAARVGYESEAAFGHAFKRCHGVSPGAYRRSGATGG
ncbi:MAG: AraC family transcriptional regulator, partial [Phycisphaerales bacterium]|nr:AraC family transcriptional regulator [Phycisphaerales bacterium]